MRAVEELLFEGRAHPLCICHRLVLAERVAQERAESLGPAFQRHVSRAMHERALMPVLDPFGAFVVGIDHAVAFLQAAFLDEPARGFNQSHGRTIGSGRTTTTPGSDVGTMATS